MRSARVRGRVPGLSTGGDAVPVRAHAASQASRDAAGPTQGGCCPNARRAVPTGAGSVCTHSHNKTAPIQKTRRGRNNRLLRLFSPQRKLRLSATFIFVNGTTYSLQLQRSPSSIPAEIKPPFSHTHANYPAVFSQTEPKLPRPAVRPRAPAAPGAPAKPARGTARTSAAAPGPGGGKATEAESLSSGVPPGPVREAAVGSKILGSRPTRAARTSPGLRSP